jgi:chaperonin GroEL
MTQRLVFQPHTRLGFQKGINLLVDAIRPTLGPLPRLVAIDPISRGNKQPTLMDNGGLIARRIIELPDRDADMGAMFLRQVIWKQHEEVGDGTATTAVLFQSVYNQGVKYIAAGGNPMRLRHYLETGMKVVLDTLAEMTLPLDSQEAITRLALSICHDKALANALGEIFDTIREHGMLEIRSGNRREMEHEYLQGAFFKLNVNAQTYFPNGQRQIELTDAAIFISNLDFDEPEHLIRIVALAYALKKKTLFILAKRLSPRVVGVLASVNKDPQQFQAVAISSPESDTLDDMALLTGGRAFLQILGDTIASANPSDLGAVRRIWANKDYLGIAGGKGSPLVLREHVSMLRRAIVNTNNLEMRKKLRERIGRLMGGAAILRVGGCTDTEIKLHKENAERTAEAIRSAFVQGIVPGGGAALLACRPILECMAENAENLDEKMAYRILSRALEEPTRAMLENAGYEPGAFLAQMTDGVTGFDVYSGKLLNMAEAGVVDSAGVIQSAVHQAFASVALALTIDVLVHHQQRETSINP